MSRGRTSRSLFGDDDSDCLGPDAGEAPPPAADAPLAERMRPRSLDEFVGQSALVGPGRLLRRLMESSAAGRSSLPSMILWGGPGTGKTTLARILARGGNARFEPLSAVAAGIREVRDVLERARAARDHGRRTVLFLDEIHRFNKAQQDALLPAVEDGTISLIGASTENPSFEVVGALLSRCRVLVLQPLTGDDLLTILNRSLVDADRGLAALRPSVNPDQLRRLAQAAGGDARAALSTLEAAVLAAPPDPQGVRVITDELLIESIGRARFAYDKRGEDHYNLISALIKSVRNSDANASVYWLARLIEGGADPMFIARRLCILASEDIGLADPRAMEQASSAAAVTHLIGLPEALYPLTQAVLYLATSPKSNAVKRAYSAAADDAAATAREPVPSHLRNAVTPLMKQVGYGEGYRYAHDDPAARQEMRCLPEVLRDRVYFDPDHP